MTIELYAGPRTDLVWSFREAEDSESLLASYLDEGLVWVARNRAGEVIGHLQAVPRDDGTAWEVTNTAVVESARGEGVGRRLLDRAVAAAKEAGAARVVLATGAQDTGNVRFYRRCGFRITHTVRDYFVPANGYPDEIVVDGIPLRDQVWFERVL
ncbi:GNAT family N-acetyltransferase [Nocardioides cynanchi]|uniref:GNAT family N-acetyltransferase n=1 Tax=Nocardioides cynanchi TaxID=2558918 RepID=UPI001780D9DC|nr:GNAT family N-acetyltransferase [Nocardioides cynanchi]